jgi:hypothetical protein
MFDKKWKFQMLRSGFEVVQGIAEGKEGGEGLLWLSVSRRGGLERRSNFRPFQVGAGGTPTTSPSLWSGWLAA